MIIFWEFDFFIGKGCGVYGRGSCLEFLWGMVVGLFSVREVGIRLMILYILRMVMGICYCMWVFGVYFWFWY